MSVIDEAGYRSNVGIIIMNQQRRLFWARRVGRSNAWQFPQGGVAEGETPEQTLYRELYEEVGLRPEDVKVLASTQEWLHYDLPPYLIRHHMTPLCIGQKQKWFLLEMVGSESNICFDCSPIPEFDHWRWVTYWYPLCKVIDFKKEVYQKALREFAPVVFGEAPRPRERSRRKSRSSKE